MSRLLSRAACDARLQLRNGFYYAAAAVVAMLVLVLSWAPRGVTEWLLPLALFANVMTNGFYFAAGLVLLEKAEHSLDAQLVTPLRPAEYLCGKLATLGLLSLVESFAIIMFALGPSAHWFVIGLGVALATATLGCFGLLLVARYDSINEFLVPSVAVTTLLSLPLLDVVGVLESRLWLFHPLHASIGLLAAGTEPVSVPAVVVMAGVGVLWAAFVFALCLRGLHRFVIAEAAAR